MALPTSGQLKLFWCGKEVVIGDYTAAIPDSTVLLEFPNGISLTEISTGTGAASDDPINQLSQSKPDGSTPHAMSEFRGYNDQASAWFTNFEPFNLFNYKVYDVSPNGNGSGIGEPNNIGFDVRFNGDGNSGFGFWEMGSEGVYNIEAFVIEATDLNDNIVPIDTIRLYQGTSETAFPYTQRASSGMTGTINGIPCLAEISAQLNTANGRYIFVQIDKEDGSESTVYKARILLFRSQ